MASIVNDEYDRLAELIQTLGGSRLSSSSSSSASSSSSSSSSTTTTTTITANNEVRQLRKENKALKQENTLLANLLSEEQNTAGGDVDRTQETLRSQILLLTSQLAAERALHTSSEAGDNDQVRQLLIKNSALEKKNARDHQKMRMMREELMNQSTEADLLARQNESILRQSGMHSGGGRKSAFSGTTTSKTEDRLHHLEHEFSELQRGGDDLMLSSISGIHHHNMTNDVSGEDDDSELYSTALPYERRQSMNIDLGASKIHVNREGETTVKFQAVGRRSTNRGGDEHSRRPGNDVLDVDELE